MAKRAKKEGTSELKQKWSQSVLENGYVAVPDLLLRYQNRLELKSNQMNVLIQLLSFWWASDSKAFPSVSNLAERIGVTKRTVQLSLNELENKKLVIFNKQISGLIRREVRIDECTGSRQSNVFHFDNLVSALKLLALETGEDERHRNTRTPVSKKRAVSESDFPF